MMKRIAPIVLAASCLSAAAAHAQSFDGLYKGTFKVTKRIVQGGVDSDCPPLGGQIPITIEVRGSAVTNVNPFATYIGTIDPEGRFEIRGSRMNRSGFGRVAATYIGVVRGRLATGTAVSVGTGGECHGTFSARK